MNEERINKWAAKVGMEVIIRHRFVFLALIVPIIVAGFLGMQRLVIDSSNESFLPEGDEISIQNDRFKEIFGNEEFLFIFIEADEIFQPDVLEYIRTLGDDIEKNLPFVKDVMSIADTEYMNTYDDVLEIEDLVGDDIPTDRQSLEEIKKKALSSRMLVDRIITRDTRNTGIFVAFERMPEYVYAPVSKNFNPLDEASWPAEKVIMRDQIFTEAEAQQRNDPALAKVRDPRKLIAPAAKVIVERHRNPNYKVIAIGVPIFDYDGELISERQGGKLGTIAFLVSIAFLFLIFRRVKGVVAPVIVILSTIIIIYGLMGWLGTPASHMSMMIPTLLLVISVSYSIHFINHFRQSFRRTGLRRESVRYAFMHAAWPCFVTAITTAVGFASFIIVPMKPIRDMGLFCAIGVFIAYLLVITVVPIIFSFGRDKPVKTGDSNATHDGNGRDSQLMAKWAGFVVKNSLAIGIAAVIVLIGAILLSLRIRVETDTLGLMGDKVDMVRNARYVTDRIGGLYSFELLIELPEDGMAKEPETLMAVDAIAAKANEWRTTTMTTSLNDMIKELNWVMHNKDDEYYAIPDSRELIAQYLLLYEMSGGEDVEDWVDYDYRMLHLSVQTSEFSSSLEPQLNDLKSFAESKLPEGTKATIVGDIPILLKMMNTLTAGQIKSIGVAFLAITLMMTFILKSFKVGLLSMVPNVFPVVMVMGAMGLLNVPLDMMTIMVAPMIIGIAVDDTVHYFIHFRQEHNKSGNYTIANRQTFQKVGYAIVFTSVVLIFGFSIFCLSIVKGMFNVGMVASVGIFSALVADLFITPVLFVHLKPFGRTEHIGLVEAEAQADD
ncbi:RND family transporter [Candidatus Poribacteria bacterium]